MNTVTNRKTAFLLEDLHLLNAFSFSFSDFEQHAIGVLQECYEENETLSQTLLVKELGNFGHLTALDLAVMAEDQDFISHTSCQVLLTRLWMGTMAMNTQWWKVRKTTSLLSGVGQGWKTYEREIFHFKFEDQYTSQTAVNRICCV